jgi:hypothetical protein
MAWTTRHWRDRILGGNTEALIKIETVFMSTGNNVTFSRELDRRLVTIDLQTPCENPSLRSGFHHDPLLTWARENRGALVHACLTLCRRWVAEGMLHGKQAMGSYESYAQVMGGILECCGVEGFLANRVRKVTANREAAQWKALVAEWYRRRTTLPTSTSELFKLIDSDVDLATLFEDVIGSDPTSQKVRLGRALEKQDGRVYHVKAPTGGAEGQEWRITRSPNKTANKTALWQLRDARTKETDNPADEENDENVA